MVSQKAAKKAAKKAKAIRFHITVEPKLMQTLNETTKCLNAVNRLLKFNVQGLAKLLKGSFKVIQ